jgi:hypothetical protein
MVETVMLGGKEASGSVSEGTGWTEALLTAPSCFSVLIVTASPLADWKVTGAPEDDWIVKEEEPGC